MNLSLQMAGYKGVPPIADFRLHREDWWRTLFHVEKVETQNRKFGWTMLTDGKAVALYLERPKPFVPPRQRFDEEDLSCLR